MKIFWKKSIKFVAVTAIGLILNGCSKTNANSDTSYSESSAGSDSAQTKDSSTANTHNTQPNSGTSEQEGELEKERKAEEAKKAAEAERLAEIEKEKISDLKESGKVYGIYLDGVCARYLEFYSPTNSSDTYLFIKHLNIRLNIAKYVLDPTAENKQNAENKIKSTGIDFDYEVKLIERLKLKAQQLSEMQELFLKIGTNINGEKDGFEQSIGDLKTKLGDFGKSSSASVELGKKLDEIKNSADALDKYNRRFTGEKDENSYISQLIKIGRTLGVDELHAVTTVCQPLPNI